MRPPDHVPISDPCPPHPPCFPHLHHQGRPGIHTRGVGRAPTPSCIARCADIGPVTSPVNQTKTKGRQDCSALQNS